MPMPWRGRCPAGARVPGCSVPGCPLPGCPAARCPAARPVFSEKFRRAPRGEDVKKNRRAPRGKDVKCVSPFVSQFVSSRIHV